MAFTFYDAWLSRQHALLQRMDHLLSPEDGFDRNKECEEMITQVFSQYQDYCAQRTRETSGDVSLALSPPWLTSFEKSMLWVAGFRPTMLFPILYKSVGVELSVEQQDRVEDLRERTRLAEEQISHGLARAQLMVAEEPAFSSVRAAADSVTPGTEVGLPMEGVKAALREVVDRAHRLRRSTAAEVVGALSSTQGVKFLAAAARFQMQARKFGTEKDSEREREREMAAMAAGN